MKEKKIPFTLSEYKKGGYYVKCGHDDAKIIYTELENSDYPIVAIISYAGTHVAHMFS